MLMWLDADGIRQDPLLSASRMDVLRNPFEVSEANSSGSPAYTLSFDT
jgi:hypothetical protein